MKRNTVVQYKQQKKKSITKITVSRDSGIHSEKEKPIYLVRQ